MIRPIFLLFLVLAASTSGVMGADMDSALREADAMRDQGTRVSATWPIFHQIVLISFPKGFVPAFEDNHPPSYLHESVLQGETVNNWTQIVTITGAQGAALNANSTPESVTGYFIRRRQQTCPSTYSGVRLPAEAVAKFNGTITLIGCGSFGQPGQERSEATLLIILKGDQDYYTVQWAERGPASSGPIVYDTKIWLDRLQQLLPIRICDKVVGEQAPFPSCINPKAE